MASDQSEHTESGTGLSPNDETLLYMVVPPSPLLAAHWSFLIPGRPSNSSETKVELLPTTGRRIHVSGDRLNGFALEIIRGYDVSKHRSVGSRQYPIGLMSASLLQDDPFAFDAAENCREKDEDEGGGYIDNKPRDTLEQACVQVEAPGSSLNKASDSRWQKAEVRDCQQWVGKVVETLVEQEILGPLLSEEDPEQQSPTARVARLPKN